MSRILLRSGKDPFLSLSVEETLARNVFGSNTGNMMFAQSVHEVLAVPGAEIVANGYQQDRMEPDPAMAARINEEYDAFVIPLANAFRSQFLPELRRLTALIRLLEIPVVVVGVGAQTTPTATQLPEAVRDDTADFLRAVLARSASIGVRGEITRRCLAALGFGDEHVDLIGCPSLFWPGRAADVHTTPDGISTHSRLAVNLTLSRPRMGRILDHALTRYDHLTYIPQTRRELELLTRGTPIVDDVDPAMPTTREHPLYANDQVRMFLDPTTWIDFLGDQDFSFGTRLHGNIAALLAGTPAFLLTFDSRTTEVAEHHCVPHAPLDAVSADVDPSELYERADMSAFNTARAGLLGQYTAFLEKNALAHVYQPGMPDPGFDKRLARAGLPGPVTAGA